MKALTQDQFFKWALARQCGDRWIDRSARGSGNRAARRAIRTERGREHIQYAGEPIYTDRPAILNRGLRLLIADKYGRRFLNV